MILRTPQLKERWKNIPRSEEVFVALCQTPIIQQFGERGYDVNEADAAMLDYYRRMEASALAKHESRKSVYSTRFLKLAEKHRHKREAIETILKGLEV